MDDMIKYFDHEGFVSYGDVTYIDLTCFQIEKEFVLRRSDGTSLYSTRDLAYHRYKATQGDVVLDILGSDHKLAAQQINVIFKEILREIPPEVIFYEFITLPSGSMSTRKGYGLQYGICRAISCHRKSNSRKVHHGFTSSR